MENQNSNQAQTAINPVPIQPTTYVNPNVNQEITPPKKNITLTIILFIILILSVSSVSAYYLLSVKKQTPKPQVSTVIPTVKPLYTATPTPDETANWKTYTNNYWKYSFKYPSTWAIPNFPQQTNSQIEIVNYDFGNSTSKAPSRDELFIIAIQINKDQTKTDQWIKYYKEAMDQQKKSYEFTNLKQVQINGQNGIYFDLKAPGTGDLPLGRTLLGSPYNFLVELTFWRSSKNQDNITIYQKILSTFKFLPISPTGIDENNKTKILSDKIFGKVDYPKELLSVDEKDLSSIKCTAAYQSNDYYGPTATINYLDNKTQDVISDAQKQNLVSENVPNNKKFTDIQFCKIENGDYIWNYGITGAIGPYTYFKLSETDGNTKDITTIYHPILWFDCNKALMLTKSGILYYQCSGSDNNIQHVTDYQIIYKIDLNKNTSSKFYQCTAYQRSISEYEDINCSYQ